LRSFSGLIEAEEVTAIIDRCYPLSEISPQPCPETAKSSRLTPQLPTIGGPRSSSATIFEVLDTELTSRLAKLLVGQRAKPCERLQVLIVRRRERSRQVEIVGIVMFVTSVAGHGTNIARSER
jgi:hypothetical protein